MGQKIISALREDTFRHIESLSHSQLNNIPVGTLVTRVTNDTQAISRMFTGLLVNMLKNCLVIVAVLVAMLFIPIPAEPWAMWVYAGLLGTTMLVSGPFMLGNWSMVADCVDAQEIQTGTREEASVYATYSLAR